MAPADTTTLGPSSHLSHSSPSHPSSSSSAHSTAPIGPTSSSHPQWHLVSPSSRPLILEIVEITSLTLTIALSLNPQVRHLRSVRSRVAASSAAASLSSSGHVETEEGGAQSVASSTATGSVSTISGIGTGTRQRRKQRSKGQTSSISHTGISSATGTGMGDSDDELTAVEDGGNEVGFRTRRDGLRIPPSFKDLLSNGIVVTINGQPWNRIVAHVNDEEGATGQGSSSVMGAAGVGSGEGSSGVGHASANIKHRLSTEGDSATSAAGPMTTTNPTTNEPVPTHIEPHATADRAVVVIYGLEPGKEYQVDLRVIGGVYGDLTGSIEARGGSIGENGASASTNVTTPHRSDRDRDRLTGVETGGSNSSMTGGSANRSRANSIRGRAANPVGRSRSNSLIQAANAANKNDSATTPDALPNKHQPIDLFAPRDAHAAHLKLLISAATSEREELQAQLKKSRRESQKAEAALKSETEALKRAMDKTTLPDQRSRQKSLALQEQVKQAFAAAQDAEAEHDSIVEGMTDVEKEEEAVREEWETLQARKHLAIEERNKALEADRKEIETLDAELATLVIKLEKQVGRKEKIDKENDELRHKLDDVASARREVEKRNEAIRQQRLVNTATPAAYMEYDPQWTRRSYSPTPRPFYPNQRPVPPQQQAAAAVLATQGIPRSSTTSLSHLGNPTGFFATTGNLPQTQRFRNTGASPMLATAAPFMPREGVNVSFVSPAPSPTAQEHHTSLVPPQLQHRIYLPGNRSNRPSPPSTADSPAAFPPLPNSGSNAAQSSGKSSSGPTLASIVTRAIIPPSSALSPQNSNKDESSPPGSRPTSWAKQEGAPEFAPLATGSSPWSPIGSPQDIWGSRPRLGSDDEM